MSEPCDAARSLRVLEILGAGNGCCKWHHTPRASWCGGCITSRDRDAPHKVTTRLAAVIAEIQLDSFREALDLAIDRATGDTFSCGTK